MNPFNFIVYKYQDYNSIDVNSAEKPRLHWKHRRACWKYRKQVENSRKPGRQVIDNIDIGFLTEWLNPVQLGVNMLNPGGEVYLPTGTYTQTDNTVTGVDNFTMRGSGYATIMKMALTSKTNQKLLQLSSKDYAEISHLRFWGDSGTINTATFSSEFQHGIDIVNSTNVWVHNCWIDDMCGDGIYIGGTSSDINISNNIIVNTQRDAGNSIGRNCVACVEGSRINISDNEMRYGFPATIDLETNTDDDYTIADVVISNNIIRDSLTYGISLNPVTATGGKTALLERVNVTGNIIRDTVSCGIYVYANETTGTATAENITINDNILEDCSDVGAARPGSIELRVCDDVKVTDNLIKGSGSNGIITQASQSHIEIVGNRVETSYLHGIFCSNTSGNESSYFKITDNVCKNNSTSAANTYDGIVCQYLDKSVIDTNYCYDTNGTPNHKYGIEIQNCDDMFFGTVHGTGFGTALFRLATVDNIRLKDARPLATWWYDDVAQGLSITGMKIGSDEAGASKIEMPFDCYVVAVAVFANDSITAGTLSCRVNVNGTGKSGTDVTLTTSNPLNNYKVIGDSPQIVAQGEYLNMDIFADGTMTPDGTVDVRATIFVI